MVVPFSVSIFHSWSLGLYFCLLMLLFFSPLSLACGLSTLVSFRWLGMFQGKDLLLLYFLR
ncbi:hypothetical protein RchiOBHm_Chr2g0159841 [Rosa chinensis]|uniref:Uncharacterized protein n=1 Tax=Rosa chinensis TaxID=74649 RepID=A0A2P6S2D9_ROSCH|nr:hypothetical protein RchiOBHm_Chr2g0159841 [Rosa chinensis]